MIKIFGVLFLYSVTSLSITLPQLKGQYIFDQSQVQVVLSRKEILFRVVNKESENLLAQFKENGSTCVFYAQQIFKCTENLKLQDLDNVSSELSQRLGQTSIHFFPTQFSPELTHEAPILTEYELIQSVEWKGLDPQEESQFAKVKFMISQDYFKIVLISKFSNDKKYFFMNLGDLNSAQVMRLFNQEVVVKNQKTQSKYEVSRTHKYWVQTTYAIDK